MQKQHLLKRKFFLIPVITFIFLCLNLVISAQSGSVQQIISETIKEGKEAGNIIVDGIRLFDQDSMPNYYFEHDYAPIWSSKENRNEMLAILESSIEEGLLPDDYHLLKIKSLLNDIQNGNNNNSTQASLDLLLSDAMVLYARHLMWGKVNQSKIRKKWNVPEAPRPADVDRIFTESIANHTLPQLFQELGPQHFMYYH